MIIDTKNERVEMFGKSIKAFRTKKVGHLCEALNEKVYLGKLKGTSHQILINNIEKLKSLTKNEGCNEMAQTVPSSQRR